MTGLRGARPSARSSTRRAHPTHRARHREHPTLEHPTSAHPTCTKYSPKICPASSPHSYVNHPAVARLLLDNGAPVNERDAYGYSALHFAAIHSSASTAEVLLERGADVNLTHKNGYTPLHRASSVELAELLLARGASVNQPNGYGDTPLHLGAMNGRLDLVQLLCSYAERSPSILAVHL